MANNSGQPEDLISGGGYQDHGCSVAPRCLPLWIVDRDGVFREVPGTGCPLPDCIFKETSPRDRYDAILAERDSKVAGMLAGGASVGEVAERFGVTRRTIFRIQRKLANKAGQNGSIAMSGREEDPWACPECGRQVPKWDVQRHREGGRCNDLPQDRAVTRRQERKAGQIGRR